MSGLSLIPKPESLWTPRPETTGRVKRRSPQRGIAADALGRSVLCTAWQNGRVMSRGKPQKPSGRRRVAGGAGLLLAVPLLVAGLVAGCNAPAPVVSGGTAAPSAAPSDPSNAAPAVTPSAAPAVTPGAGNPSASASLGTGTAALKQTMESALKSIAAASPKPAQDAVRAQLVSAGIPGSAVEVSASKTPTGLDVDAIAAAARLDKDCVMGEIRDGQVSVSVLPVLASGKCFVGDSR